MMERIQMRYESENIIVQFEKEGLIIIRKNANLDDTSTIVLTPSEAHDFASIWAMGNGAIQVYYMNGSHHAIYGDEG